MGLGCAGSHLLHEVASRSGCEMPINGHHRYPEPTGGTYQSVILSELLWHRPGVSVFCCPSSGFWPDGSLVDPTHTELLSHGLFHRDHCQYLHSWSDSPESLTAEGACHRAHGHVAASHHGEPASNCWCQPGPQTTDPATYANSSWPLSDEAQGTSSAGAYSRMAGNDAGYTLLATGVPTEEPCPQTERHPQYQLGSRRPGWRSGRYQRQVLV